MGIFGGEDTPNENVNTESNDTPESDATSIADERAAFETEKAEFEAEKKALADEKVDYATQKEADEAAMLEKQTQIDDYQEKVKSNNREVEHIDFDKTNIKFIGKKRVGKPTAKAPTKRLNVDLEEVDVK